MNSTAIGRKTKLENVVACPLCGSPRKSWVHTGDTFGAGLYGRDLFSIYRCRDCGIGITDPVPPESNSHELYGDRTSCDFQVDDSPVAAALKKMAATHDARVFTGGVPLRQSASKILDYACGNGAFAVAMRTVVPDSAVWATDYHTEAPPLLRSTDIHYTAYEDLASHGPFDFILCRHVLEHTYDPVEFLRGIAELLNPGGVLMIEVPNLRAPLSGLFGKYWDGN
jgi:SAM-dependent methyltransferase